MVTMSSPFSIQRFGAVEVMVAMDGRRKGRGHIPSWGGVGVWSVLGVCPSRTYLQQFWFSSSSLKYTKMTTFNVTCLRFHRSSTQELELASQIQESKYSITVNYLLVAGSCIMQGFWQRSLFNWTVKQHINWLNITTAKCFIHLHEKWQTKVGI